MLAPSFCGARLRRDTGFRTPIYMAQTTNFLGSFPLADIAFQAISIACPDQRDLYQDSEMDSVSSIAIQHTLKSFPFVHDPSCSLTLGDCHLLETPNLPLDQPQCWQTSLVTSHIGSMNRVVSLIRILDNKELEKASLQTSSRRCV